MTLAVAAARAATLAAADQSNNPFVAWNNAAAGATLTGTGVLADGDRINAVMPGTWNFWRPDISGTEAILDLEFAAARSFGFAGVEAHNIATLGGTAQWERSTDAGANWSDAGAGPITPATDRALGWRMVPTGNDADRWRLRVSGLTAGDPLAVGIAFLGDDLVMEQRAYQGLRPPIWPTRADGEVNVSAGGHPLGSDVRMKGGTFSLPLEDLTDAFVRSADFTAFADAWNRCRCAFVHWRPAKYPGDLIYAWREGRAIDPSNTGPRAYMGLALEMGWYAG